MHKLIQRNQDKFERLYSLYEDYNSHTNISAIRDKAEILVKHFEDSLSILEFIDFDKDVKVLDLGSGGGFPVLPLALVLPEVKFTALDATAKKTKFIEIVKSELSLNNLEIVNARAEELAHEEIYRESFDFVLARAVAQLNILLELSCGFLKVKGSLMAYKAVDIEAELQASASSQKALNLSLVRKFPVSTDKQILQFNKGKALKPELPRSFQAIKSKPL